MGGLPCCVRLLAAIGRINAVIGTPARLTVELGPTQFQELRLVQLYPGPRGENQSEEPDDPGHEQEIDGAEAQDRRLVARDDIDCLQ